jgi:hypothetical protein
MKRVSSRRTIALAGTLACALVAGLPARAETAPPAPANPPATAPGDGAGRPASGLPAPTDAAARPASTEPALISLDLSDTTLEQALQRLGAAMGSEIRLEGAGGRRVSLKLEGATVLQALDRAAAVLHGTWKRLFIFTKTGGLVPPPAQPTGLTVSLSLTDTNCQTAAIIAAKAAGGRMEAEGELPGRVTLVGKDLPVEEAMNKIAKAAGMTWRTVYLFKAADLPAATNTEVKPPANPDGRNVDPKLPVYERDRGRYGPKGNQRFHSMPKERRTRYNQLGKYGAKMPARQVPDVDKMEKLSRLGAFAGVFSADDEKEREERIKRFRAALETQSRRLEGYKPEYRKVATKLAKSQLQSILDDAKALDEQQKKEVAPVLDYIRKRLQELK